MLVSTGTQTEAKRREGDFSIFKFKDDPKVVNYYTGFDNYEHFMFVFNIMGPAAFELNYGLSTSSTSIMDPRE